MMPKYIHADGSEESGFQFCNLTEINGSKVTSLDTLVKAARAASILGTLQAGYTNFTYLSDISKKITEKEALIGVSITGWMNQPAVLFNKVNLKVGAETVKTINAQVSKILGINPAARTTCVKPSGNASVILGTGSGIHGEHSKNFIRNVQMNEQEEVLQLIMKTNPEMVEPSVWSSTGTDYVVGFPIETNPEAITKKDLLGIKQLEYVKKAQQIWIEYGTNEELGTHPKLRHNVSNTITVNDWEEVEEYIYQNRQWFAGISLLAASGDKSYPQAPFTEVLTASEIITQYGEGALFASGLIVDGLSIFSNNLWTACATIKGEGITLEETNSKHVLHRDWVRRAKKFAVQYFNSDVEEMINCLKDCYNLHKWESIRRNFKDIDFTNQLSKKQFTDVDTLAGAACAGGACEVTF